MMLFVYSKEMKMKVNNYYPFRTLYLSTLNVPSEYSIFKNNLVENTIIKNGDRRQFKIHTRFTQTDLIIPADLNHPWQLKCSKFHFMVNRLY